MLVYSIRGTVAPDFLPTVSSIWPPDSYSKIIYFFSSTSWNYLNFKFYSLLHHTAENPTNCFGWKSKINDSRRNRTVKVPHMWFFTWLSLLRYSCTRFSASVFFIKSMLLVPWSFSRLFLNIKSNSLRYSNSKVIPRIIRIRGKNFFCHVRAISKVVLV